MNLYKIIFIQKTKVIKRKTEDNTDIKQTIYNLNVHQYRNFKIH